MKKQMMTDDIVYISKLERWFISIALGLFAILVTVDVFIDLGEGASNNHIAIEVGIAVVAHLGFFTLVRSYFSSKSELRSTQIKLKQINEDATRWSQENKKFVEGLSIAIEGQFNSWGLSVSEKDVAMLLLKGLSLKEIADIRHTTEKTARAQSVSIYQKSGLAGRSELSAFFLEDLLSSREIV